MKTIETVALVTEDATLIVPLPPGITPGKHKVVVVIEENPVEQKQQSALDLPVIRADEWPEDLSLRREDMYDEWGR